MSKFLTIVGLFVIISAGVYFGFLHKFQTAEPTPSASPTSTPNPTTYRNDQYGFEISLSAQWKGYTVRTDQWEGRTVATGKVTEHGPLIILRHPQWTNENQREDMPIMVFTLAQWSLINQEKLSVGAAPIPPSELARNSKFVLALPARYNYDFKTGWEEVDQLVHTLKAFEPKSASSSKGDQVCIQVITRAKNPQTGEVRDFPTPCDIPAGWEIQR